MKRHYCLCAVLAALLALACTANAAEKEAPKPPRVGDQMVDFTLKDLGGRKIPTAKARGRILVLKFGATWCGWCTKAIPELNKVKAAYPKTVVVLDVNIREDAKTVRAHNRKHRATYITLLDTTGAVANRYGVSGIPVVMVIDTDGKIVFSGYYTPFETLRKTIDPLVKEMEDRAKAAAEEARRKETDEAVGE